MPSSAAQYGPATGARLRPRQTPARTGGAGQRHQVFERHASLLTALLDERFDGEASRQGWWAFLGALPEDDHWLLIAPLAPGLLPFAQMRVRASELLTTPLPAAASCW